MPVIVNEKFVAETFCVDNEPAGTIRPQPNDLANDTIARHFDGSEETFLLEGECPRRDEGGDRAAKKSASINKRIHRLRRLRRFTEPRNLRNLCNMPSSPVARADGCDLNARAIHRPGLGFRTKVRRHSFARLQEG